MEYYSKRGKNTYPHVDQPEADTLAAFENKACKGIGAALPAAAALWRRRTFLRAYLAAAWAVEYERWRWRRCRTVVLHRRHDLI